ncbi:MAG: hypothetical protein ACOCQC_03810 [Halanaerobiaceae bacterium]
MKKLLIVFLTLFLLVLAGSGNLFAYDRLAEGHDYYREFYPDKWKHFLATSQVRHAPGAGMYAFRTIPFRIDGGDFGIQEVKDMENKLFISSGLQEGVGFRGNIGYGDGRELHGYGQVKIELTRDEKMSTAFLGGAYLSNAQENTPEARFFLDYDLGPATTLYNQIRLDNSGSLGLELRNGVEHVIDEHSVFRGKSSFGSWNNYDWWEMEAGFRHVLEPDLDYIGFLRTVDLRGGRGLINYIENGLVYRPEDYPFDEISGWFSLHPEGDSHLQAALSRELDNGYDIKGKGRLTPGTETFEITLVAEYEF